MLVLIGLLGIAIMLIPSPVGLFAALFVVFGTRKLIKDFFR